MNNFWQNLKKPIFCLAPMEEVTDVVYREMFARHSNINSGQQANGFVMFTEFISTDGLMHPEGRKKMEIDLKFTENQHPIVAQIWGNDPEKFYQSAQYLAGLGFDGIDINMGCPQEREIKLNTCAALIKNPKLAQEIILATKKGAGQLPVSVKTRTGYLREEVETWIPALLETEPAVITLHGRSKKEKSKVPAHWDIIKKAAEIVHGSGKQTLILGNGDVQNREDGLKKIVETGVDGVMIGRGSFGNPWLFRSDNYHPDITQRLRALLEHAELYNQVLGNYKPFVIMRKSFKAYVSGFVGAHELRAKLMETNNFSEVKSIVEEFLEKNSLK